MKRSHRTLGIIPARSGSKGIPGKNLRPLGGKPLLLHTLETAMDATPPLLRTVISTDDERIAETAQLAGADVPFIRPTELATDETPMLPVVQHALHAVEEMDKITFDWVCLLQPTAPFRTAEDIRRALKLASENECDSVISVVRAIATHPALMKKVENNRVVPYCEDEVEGTRRQDLSPHAYMRNGAIYLTRRDVVMSGSLWGQEIVPLVMDEFRSVSIDSKLDFELAEVVLKHLS